MSEHNSVTDHFTSVIRDAGMVSWAEPTAVRRRGQQRGRRKAAVAALAAVLVVGVGVGSVWTLRDRRGVPVPPGPPATTAPSTATPSPTADEGPYILDTQKAKALLWETDVTSDHEYVVEESQEDDDHAGLTMLMSYCGQSDSAALPHEVGHYRQWVKQTDGPRYVLQEFREYEPTWAQRHIADLRTAVSKCPTVDIMASATERSTLVIMDYRINGVQMLVVKDTRTGAAGTSVGYHAVIVKGDFETSLRANLPDVPEEVVIQTIGTAAERLCQAAGTECDPYASAPPG